MSLHDLVTCALVYLSIGGVIWLVLDGLGIIDNTFAVRPDATGRAMVLATLMMIFGWPKFIWSWVDGMRGARR